MSSVTRGASAMIYVYERYSPKKEKIYTKVKTACEVCMIDNSCEALVVFKKLHFI